MKKNPALRVRNIVLLVLPALIFCPAAGLSAQEEMTLEDLALAADSIIIGTVLNAGSAMDTASAPMTLVNIRMEELITATQVFSVSDTITLRHRGGIVGGVNMIDPEAVTLDPGELVVLFLDHPGPEDWFFSLIGSSQGKFPIIGSQVQMGDHTMSLSDFIAEIQMYLGGK